MMLVLLILIVSLFLSFKKYLFGIKNQLPPGPNLLQILPNISLLVSKPQIALKNYSKIYGPLFCMRLGAQLVVVASSPATAEEIYKTQDRVFSGRYLPSVYHDIPGKDATLVMARECNDMWKFLRSIGHNSIFSSRAIESAAGIRAMKAMEMVKFLRTNKEGKVVNIEDVIFATLSNIITNVLTSRNLFEPGGEGERDEMVVGFVNGVMESGITLGLTDVYPILKGVDFWSKGRAMDMYRKIKLIWGDIIKERRARHVVDLNSTQDFLDILIRSSYSDDQIGILLMELLMTSTDSTAITAVWLMAELIKNQEILHKVREEITYQALEGNTLNELRLSECKYFQACIRETLRLHNPSPFGVPHRAIQTCKVNNYTIPKDSIVMVNAWAIQVDPDNWKDAMCFKPERFLNTTIDFNGTHFEYIPFSAGLRKCPGSNVAVKGVQLVVASLLHYFDWSLPSGKDPSELDMSGRFRTTLKMDKPFYLIPRLREKYVITCRESTARDQKKKEGNQS